MSWSAARAGDAAASVERPPATVTVIERPRLLNTYTLAFASTNVR